MVSEQKFGLRMLITSNQPALVSTDRGGLFIFSKLFLRMSKKMVDKVKNKVYIVFNKGGESP